MRKKRAWPETPVPLHAPHDTAYMAIFDPDLSNPPPLCSVSPNPRCCCCASFAASLLLLILALAADLAARVAKARYPEVLLASLAGRAVEARPLRQAVEDGMEMVSRLSACVANATAAEGGYGLGGHEVCVCARACVHVVCFSAGDGIDLDARWPPMDWFLPLLDVNARSTC